MKALMAKWNDYLLWERNVASRTAEEYVADVTAMSAHLPDLDVLTPGDLRAWATTEAHRGVGRSTIQRRLAAYRNFIDWATGAKLPVNIKDVPTGGKQVRKLPRPMTEAQCLDIISGQRARGDWIGLRNAALYTVLWASGLRISEALALRIACPLTAGASTMVVKGKGGHQRMVVILPQMRAAIDAYLVALPHQLEDDAPLFVSERGLALSQTDAATTFAGLRDANGLPDSITLHSWRHSFATHMLNAGANLRQVQELLGHKSIRTTQVYTLVAIDRLLEQYDAAMSREAA